MEIITEGQANAKSRSKSATMFRIGVRRFATSAARAAETISQMEGPNSYGIQVSRSQGVVKGLTGGKSGSCTIGTDSDDSQLLGILQ